MENTNPMKFRKRVECSIPSWVAVCLKGILYIILAIIAICIIICLPDLILGTRNLLSKFLPISPLPTTESDKLTIDNYIIMILTVCSCIVTAALTYVAFRLSKSLGNIQLCEQKAKKILWARTVEQAISSHFGSLHKWKTAQIPVQIKTDIMVGQYVINLYTTNTISNEDREMLTGCLDSFNLFLEKLPNDVNTATMIADKMIAQHLEITSTGFKYAAEMKTLLAKLEEIGKEDA